MTYGSLLVDTCDIYRFTEGAADAYGIPAKTWAVVYNNEPCRLVDAKGREIYTGAEVVIADYMLFVDDIVVSEQDRVLINSQLYEIILAQECKNGLSDNHHRELYLRKVR